MNPHSRSLVTLPTYAWFGFVSLVSTTLLLCLLASAVQVNAQQQGWSATGSLGTARLFGHTTNLLANGKVLVVGGINIANPCCRTTVSAELYDPETGQWSTTGSLSMPRGNHVAVRLANGKILVAGGNGDPFSTLLTSAEIYDPDTGAWSAAGDLNVARTDHIATLLADGRVLVTGGSGTTALLNSAELYDPTTGQWNATGSLTAPRSGHTATLLPNGKVLVVSGFNSNDVPQRSAELYDPATGGWAATSDLITARGTLTATLLRNGKVLVAGGAISSHCDQVNGAELYDPATGQWSATGSLTAPRAGHTATLLPDGKVIVAGGDTVCNSLNSAELYDPATGSWSVTRSLITARSDHTATLLANGKVLVAGGDGGSTASAELYDSGMPLGAWSYTIPDRGGVRLWTAENSASVEVAYARLQPDPGNTTPSGLAIFGLRQNGALVSEAGVPASPKIRAGRIYAEVNDSVNTGLAIANPNDQSTTVSFYFTDFNGTNSGAGNFTIPANGQIASFLNHSPFSGGPSLGGTFTFDSSLPVAVVVLRGLSNERSEFLSTTMPVAELSAPLEETVIFPHFADGGGWTTQIVLVNPTDDYMNGTVQFLGQGSAAASAQPVAVTIAGQTSSMFQYAIPQRSARLFLTSGATGAVVVGSVRITPSSGQRTPSGVAVFSFKKAGVTVSEAGVPAVRSSSAFRLFAESSTSIRTGIAVVNASPDPATVRFDPSDLTGAETRLSGTATIPGNGSVALFLNQIQGLEALPDSFQGIVRVSTASPAGVSLIALRGRVNERGDFLITTIPPVDEGTTPSSEELLFPHLVDGGGYTTQFILFSGSAGQSVSGAIRFLGQLGQPLSLVQ